MNWGKLTKDKCKWCNKEKVLRDDICYECWQRIDRQIKDDITDKIKEEQMNEVMLNESDYFDDLPCKHKKVCVLEKCPCKDYEETHD